MEDTIVSYETALLAKEIGFDLESLYFYTKPNSKMYGIDEHERPFLIKNTSKKLYKSGEYASSNSKYIYYAPTQSLLQRWIREKHLLHIEIYGFVSGDEQTRQYYHCIRNMKKYCDLTDDSETFDTYEECLENALQQCLNIIKNK